MIPYLHFLYLAVGPLKIYTWGFFVSLGFLSATMVLIKKYPDYKEHFINLLLYILIGSMVGARIFFVIFYDSASIKDIFKIWEGGMSSFGGLIGGLAVILMYSHFKRINAYQLLQKVAFVLPLGLAIARIGCFLINDHSGIITIASPLSVNYPDGPRFDLGYLEMIFDGLIFVYFILKRGKTLYFENFLLIYGAGRFLLDFLRIGEPKFAGLIPSQYGSIIMIVVALYFTIKNRPEGQKV